MSNKRRKSSDNDLNIIESKENHNNSSSSSNVGDIDISNFKIGQKYSTPSPGNGDRVFYETLLTQRPDSEMAQEWCINYGVLDNDTADKYYNIIKKRKNKPNNSPLKKEKS